jgi:formylglycine-generating enzyme required for sulfatase activity
MDPSLQHLIECVNQLSDQFQELRQGVLRAVHIADADPEMALIRARKVLEYLVRDVFVRRVQEPPGTRPLENLIQRLVKDGHFPPRLEAYADTIRKLGNVGAHRFGERISPADVYQSLTQLLPILEWYFEVEHPDAGVHLGTPSHPDAGPPFWPPAAREAGHEAHVAVVPKGLRSFDANDSRFFLQLLPGPRDESGLPESIRFWKHRIEATDDATFTVGVICGPSGCGKSSLVKAGLLPRLDRRVVSVYVEASADETEMRLQNGLRKRFAGLSTDLDLIRSIAALCHRPDPSPERKIVIALDQFEQWLHAHRTEADTELARALRQCDGEHVQCIVMVRDDFWVSLSRFMGELGIQILQGENTALVDLFDPIHARKVLAEFGRSYGHLPAPHAAQSREQGIFLDSAVEGLSQEGRVVPIRLALFAEMLKGKPWTPPSLRQLGGTEGVGVAFLEETFSSAALRSHQQAGQAVLKALLPETGTDIKGRMRSYDELIEAAGWTGRPKEFGALLRTLDREVRLITPTDPEGPHGSGNGGRHDTAGRYYQLTHDYLVDSLRGWLTRKQKETWRGRTELRLAERSSLWNAKPENRLLPSALEWATIKLLTRKKGWTQLERRMMARAGRFHGFRLLALASMAALLVVLGLNVRKRVVESNQATAARGLVRQIVSADTAGVPDIIRAIKPGDRRWTDPELRKITADAPGESKEKLHASLALLSVDPGQAEYLFRRLLNASPTDLAVIRKALEGHQAELVERLWAVLENAQMSPKQRFAAACALAGYVPEANDERWSRASGFITDGLLASVIKNPNHSGSLLETLRPIRKRLLASLSATFRNEQRPDTDRSFATNILADYASDQPAVLADLLMDAERKPYAVLFPIAQGREIETVPLFRAEITKKAADEWNEAAKDRLAERQARAAVALVRLGRANEVRPADSTDPRLRSFIVRWLKPLDADPKAIAAEIQRLEGALRSSPDPAVLATDARRGSLDPAAGLSPAPNQQRMDAILYRPEISIRRALILALGTYGPESLAPGEREALIGKLLDLYKTDPDAGIHGAAESTLREWKAESNLIAADQELIKLKDWGDRRWFVNRQGQTFAVIEGPVEFRMGSPPTEPDRYPRLELPHRRIIPRRFAIATKEITVKEYQDFVKDNPGVDHAVNDKMSPDDPTVPMNRVSWYHAAAYCNWLSRQEGLPECYEPNPYRQKSSGMKIGPEAIRLGGYRLPTEGEWEYACCSGADTSRYFGSKVELVVNYACCDDGSERGGHLRPVGSLLPNELGLFDMLGNAVEWCQDVFRIYRPDRTGSIIDNISIDLIVNEMDPRLLRGSAFDSRPPDVRAAIRAASAPSFAGHNFGFRPARTYDRTSGKLD